MTTVLGSLIQPVPSDYRADETAMWFFTIWAGGMALVVLPFVFKRARIGDFIPMYMWFGGLICSLCEPMLDHLGHLWWPPNLPGPAFSGYDLDVPWLIPPCYVFFIAMTGYWVYTKMNIGLKPKHIWIVFGLAAARDFALEYPGLWLDVYRYYGDVPTKVGPFPWFWPWANGTAMMMVGFVLWLAAPYLKGKRQAFALIIPFTGFMLAYGVVGTPYFMALNWELPTVVQYLLCAWSLGMALLIVRIMAWVVTTKERNVLSDLAWAERELEPGLQAEFERDKSFKDLVKLSTK